LSWIALRVTPAANRDGVIAALFHAGSQGVHEDGDAVVTHFPNDVAIDAIERVVMRADPSATLSVSDAVEIDYSEWRASVGAHHVGELVIAPPWLASQFEPGSVVVVEPAMAFGTGEHQTTRGVMRLMQGVIRNGDVVADLGAGSAVLSIAAAKLGAGRVAAVELDQDSIGNAEENVRANGVADRVEIIEGDATVILPLLAPVRVILANILSSVLTPMLPTIRSALTADGQAILSGLVLDEREAMLDALATNRFRVEREDTEDVWWSVQIALR
jgi:ribosomal protein L11 methyltransferase